MPIKATNRYSVWRNAGHRDQKSHTRKEHCGECILLVSGCQARVAIHVQVFVNDPVPHPNDRPPGNFWMCFGEIGPDPPRGLANHLHKVGQSESKGFIGIKIGPGLAFREVQGLSAMSSMWPT